MYHIYILSTVPVPVQADMKVETMTHDEKVEDALEMVGTRVVLE